MRGLPSAWRPQELVLSISRECLGLGNESCSISSQQGHPHPWVHCAQSISGCVASISTLYQGSQGRGKLMAKPKRSLGLRWCPYLSQG